MIYYDVLLKHHPSYYHPENPPKYVCIFYDEDKTVALREMRQYVVKHGFMDGDDSIADVILRERDGTGKVISMTPYIKLFDPWKDTLREGVL
jgi:hypothetical protein